MAKNIDNHLAYGIGKIKEATLGGIKNADIGSKTLSVVSNITVPQWDTGVNNHSMQKPAKNAQEDFSLMDDAAYNEAVKAPKASRSVIKIKPPIFFRSAVFRYHS